MNQNDIELERKSGVPPHPERTAGAVSIASGAIVGAAIAVFAFAGPLAIVTFGVAGGIAGAVVSFYARKRSRRQSERDAMLDREIGIDGGDIGIARPFTR